MMVPRTDSFDIRDVEKLDGVVDTLLPGGEGFPPASSIGTAEYMMSQLRPGELDGWLRPMLDTISTLAGGDFLDCDGTGRAQALRRMESEHRPVFERLLALTYYCYYAQPAVVDVVRGMGFQYNNAPQPLGYRMEPFDPSHPEMLPQTPRGYYKRTEEIVREVQP
jgi:hypothetical protein